MTNATQRAAFIDSIGAAAAECGIDGVDSALKASTSSTVCHQEPLVGASYDCGPAGHAGLLHQHLHAGACLSFYLILAYAALARDLARDPTARARAVIERYPEVAERCKPPGYSGNKTVSACLGNWEIALWAGQEAGRRVRRRLGVTDGVW
jgi:hypothetical protein